MNSLNKKKIRVVFAAAATLLFSHTIYAQQSASYSANTHFNIAQKHKRQGDIDKAIEQLEYAIVVDPHHFEAHFHLGNAYFGKRMYNEAIEIYENALRIRPTSEQTYFNCALVLESAGKRSEAFEKLEQSLEQNPNYARARRLLAKLLEEEKRYEEATAHFDYILQHNQNDFSTQFAIAETYRKKAQTLNTQDDYEHAIAQYKRALQLKPHDKKTLFGLGYTYRMLGDLENSLQTYDTVLSFDPHCADAQYNKAHLLRYLGETADAAAMYEAVLAQWPDNAHAHYGYGESLLREGDLLNGFAEFEWRYKRGSDDRNFSEKLWDGAASLYGKTVLIRGEYGLGDTIQFLRFTKQLRDMGAFIAVEIHKPLKTLAACCPYIDQLIEIGQPLPAFDFQIPVMSLPHLLGITDEQYLRGEIPYLNLDEQLVKYWQQELASDQSFKIGVCWEGSTYYDNLRGPRSKKALHLSVFKPLADLPNVQLYSLQHGDITKQIHEVDFNVHEFDSDFDNVRGRFMDTAAVMKNLDLVVTIDTSVAHLAGALGVQAFVVLPTVCDWRWMTKRQDTPWYPTVKLFRQEIFGDWDSVFNHVAQTIEQTRLTLPAVPKKSIRADIVSAEISIGELIDKITILQLKSKYISNPKKLKNVKKELDVLCKTLDEKVPSSPQLTALTQKLYDINQQLWDIEDDCRDKERNKEFDDEFIQITRSVYITNDQRCAVKREINELLGSNLVEEKSYAAY